MNVIVLLHSIKNSKNRFFSTANEIILTGIPLEPHDDDEDFDDYYSPFFVVGDILDKDENRQEITRQGITVNEVERTLTIYWVYKREYLQRDFKTHTMEYSKFIEFLS